MGLVAGVPTFVQVGRSSGFFLDLGDWVQRKDKLLRLQRLLESTAEDCHFVLAKRSLTSHEQTLLLQQLTHFDKRLFDPTTLAFLQLSGDPVSELLQFCFHNVGDERGFDSELFRYIQVSLSLFEVDANSY